MRHTLLLFSLLMMYSCSDMPNESPYDSARSATFSVDMSEAISSNIFQVEEDTLRLVLFFDDEVQMVDGDSDGVYSCTIANLIFGKTYEYRYSINDIMETLDSDRSLTVYDEENIILDYYGELNPTTLTFFVNMSDQINEGNFDTSIQTLDVAGTFNDWSGTQLEFKEDNIYTATVADIQTGEAIEFKFRIDGNWDTSEFPGDGPNRIYEVQQGENILECWYNVEGCN